MWYPVEHTITEPETPDALGKHALATAREKALVLITDRALNLVAAQVEVERWCGRLLLGW